jgi:hypothetical protein
MQERYRRKSLFVIVIIRYQQFLLLRRSKYLKEFNISVSTIPHKFTTRKINETTEPVKRRSPHLLTFFTQRSNKIKMSKCRVEI